MTLKQKKLPLFLLCLPKKLLLLLVVVLVLLLLLLVLLVIIIIAIIITLPQYFSVALKAKIKIMKGDEA